MPPPATQIAAADVLTPEGWAGPSYLRLDGGRIAEIAPARGDVPDTIVAPGFVDLQVNGFVHLDCATAAGDEWDELGRLIARTGVTSWLPTLVTAPAARYPAMLERTAAAVAAPPVGARPIGIHLEGPFLGARTGAHRPEWRREIDRDWLRRLPEHVRLVTLGPELAGAPEAIAELTSRGIRVAIGHTAADAAQVAAAVDAGATMVTHLFNAMSGLHHRSLGVAGSALVEDRLTTGLIADGVHVDARLFPLVFRAKTARGVALVTDAIGWAAPRIGDGGIDVVGGVPRLSDGTIAGSALAMDVAVRNVTGSGVPLADALVAASTTPASVLGLGDLGRIATGARADLVVLDRSTLTVVETWVAGARVHRAGERDGADAAG